MASDPMPGAANSGFPQPLLRIRGLSIGFGDSEPVVAGVDLDLRAGRLCALVGETGAGKSLVAMALAGLQPPGATVSATRFHLLDRDAMGLDEAGWSRVRGRRIGVVFQDPFTALDPLMRIGEHLEEAIRVHTPAGRTEVLRRAVASLRRVGLPDAERRMRAFPDEFSGGMRQRVQIALALVHDPDILIADEPTASLDADARDDILDLIAGMCRERGTSALLVSHDLRSIRSRADDVLVMVEGRVVEAGSADALLGDPRHPFTSALLAAGGLLATRDVAVPIRKPAACGGCRYQRRCPIAQEVCTRGEPRLAAVSGAHSAACHLVARNGA